MWSSFALASIMVDRHAGPAADHGGDVLGGHFLAQQGVPGWLRLGKLLLQLGMRP
jgi:hypothetical protein